MIIFGCAEATYNVPHIQLAVKCGYTEQLIKGLNFTLIVSSLYAMSILYPPNNKLAFGTNKAIILCSVPFMFCQNFARIKNLKASE